MARPRSIQQSAAPSPQPSKICRVSLVSMENSVPGRFGRCTKFVTVKFGIWVKNMPGRFGMCKVLSVLLRAG